MGGDGVEAHPLHPVDRRAERDAAGDVRGARLELVGQLVPGGLLEGDGRDHVAPALPGRHGLEEGGLAVEGAHAGRAVHLVAGEGVEVAADRPHVHRQVRRRLGPVHHHHRARRVGELRHAAHGVDGAERVRHVRDRDDPGPGREEPLERGHVHLAGVVDRGDPQRRALLLAQHLPGHDVRVVLETGDQHLVARAHVLAAVAPGHEVHRLGGAAQEHDLAALRRAQEALHLRAGALVGGGRQHREVVDAAVDVRVGALVDEALGVDDRLRLLRGGGAVEVDEGLPVNGLPQDGELPPDGVDVEGGHRPRAHGCASARSKPPASRDCSSRATTLRRGSTSSFRTRSLAKAQVRRVLASGSPIPRERR